MTGCSQILDIICDQTYVLVMKKIAAARFKEQCLAILDELGPDGIVVTKHGQPVAKVIPFGRASADLIGSLRGRLVVRGDITTTRIRWDAGE